MEKITVYGTNTCPGTLRFLHILTSHGIMPDFVNITGSVGLLKEFLNLRDTLDCYEGIQGSGKIGIPLVKKADGTYVRDVDAYLKSIGIDETVF